ncbi:hypothetical protein M4951_22740 [Blastopirellula sp. J2-11]|uniref:hypothetical protein n=1 Tax=Blastopirellula sp. J2-11 TaxID=2943192 RepID=UPI0021C5AD8F|nr:hypothetical protein [Blastopirellula sp. J2-11]UUO06163.1 hypothetical protein M4951_22740 [Blastopirellula sp. J2-11]
MSQEVKTTLDMAKAAEKKNWIRPQKTPRKMPLPNGWLTMREVVRLPRPDTKRMRDPVDPNEKVRWLGGRR